MVAPRQPEHRWSGDASHRHRAIARLERTTALEKVEGRLRAPPRRQRDRLQLARSDPLRRRQNLGRSGRSIAMNSDDRQAVLDAIEAELRTEEFGYFFLEAEEFARFDISVTYLGGHDALTVQRCREHLAALYSVEDDSISTSPTSALERGQKTREALRTFFRHLYS